MDPNETLRMMLDNLSAAGDENASQTYRDNCTRRAMQHANNLMDWMAKGGFVPTVTPVGRISDPSWKVGS